MDIGSEADQYGMNNIDNEVKQVEIIEGGAGNCINVAEFENSDLISDKRNIFDKLPSLRVKEKIMMG